MCYERDHGVSLTHDSHKVKQARKQKPPRRNLMKEVKDLYNERHQHRKTYHVYEAEELNCGMTIPHQNSNNMLHGNRNIKVHVDAQKNSKEEKHS